MINWTQFDWESLATDGLRAVVKHDESSVIKLLLNVAVQIANHVSAPSELLLDANFIKELQNSTPVETTKIRFTNEGGFVME